MTNSLADVTWLEVARDAASGVLAIPLGSTEQHGPHLPLSTDTEIAVALAHALARRQPNVLVAPAVPYGSSGEHADFAGTLSIGQKAVELLVIELARSASSTFARIVLISAHGGNARPVAAATRRLRAEGRDVLAWFPRWSGDAHAGQLETSLMLALDAARVRLERAASGNVQPISELWHVLERRGVRAVSANGVLGNPAGACATEGRELLAAAADDLVTTVRNWAPSQPLPAPA